MFQLGYVTRDLQEAQSLFGQKFGIDKYLVLNEIPVTIDASSSATVSVALCYVGDTMLEFIEPQGGNDAIYRDVVNDNDSVICFHHMGYRINAESEWQAMIESLGTNGVSIALSGQAPTSRYLYADYRESLGHYLEYLMYTPEGVENIRSNIPRN